MLQKAIVSSLEEERTSLW